MDFDGFSGYSEIVNSLWAMRANHDVALFAIVSGNQAKLSASRFGNIFVIERPFGISEIRSLRYTVCGRVVRSSQAYFRMNVEIPVSLATVSRSVLQCATSNISQNEMAVATPVRLDSGEQLHLMFAIPRTEVIVSAKGTVIWDNGERKAGIRLNVRAHLPNPDSSNGLHDHFCMRLGGQDRSAEFQGKSAYAI